MDLAYCPEQTEDCLLNKCVVCGKDVNSKLEYVRSRLGELSDETLQCPIGYQFWESDNDNVWSAVEYVEPFEDLLPIVIKWIIDEKMGLHERQVALQTRFIRSVKSWNYDLNEPQSSLDRDGLLLRWDHAMRPLTTNNRELATNHWLTHGIPLMGFIATYRLNDPGNELDGKLMKRHIFFTAPIGTKDHWDFTVQAVKSTLEYLLPLIGPRKQLIFLADGSTKQVYFNILVTFMSNYQQTRIGIPRFGKD